MNIDFYERFFVGLMAVTLVIFFAAIGVSAVGSAVALSHPAGRIDPAQLETTPPFDEPGLRDLGDGRYEAVIVARAWQFTPNEVVVPAGSTVTFRVSSVDVIHGFQITGVPLNMMVIPGQLSVATATFESPGEHLIICHEYCGIGHHQMVARVVVEGSATGTDPLTTQGVTDGHHHP